MDRDEIDVEKLRKKLINDLRGAYFGGGFGAAMMEADKIENATDEEIIRMAKKKGYLREE